jgi:hypothetical protein
MIARTLEELTPSKLARRPERSDEVDLFDAEIHTAGDGLKEWFEHRQLANSGQSTLDDAKSQFAVASGFHAIRSISIRIVALTLGAELLPPRARFSGTAKT